MPNYRLVPRHLENPLWSFSTERRSVVVRAASAREARVFAARRFCIVADLREGTTAPEGPWLALDMVSATLVDDTRWAALGPAGIVDDVGSIAA